MSVPSNSIFPRLGFSLFCLALAAPHSALAEAPAKSAPPPPAAAPTSSSTAAPLATPMSAPGPDAGRPEGRASEPPVGQACEAAQVKGCAAPQALPGPALSEQVAFGSYTPGLPYYPEGLAKEEKKLGKKLDIVSGFIDWDYEIGEARDLMLSDHDRRTLLYSWEPHCREDGSCMSFRDIFEGRLDPYLMRVVDSVRRFSHDVYVRPWAEMNASWSPYLPGSSSPRAGSADEFKRAWRYLYTFFRNRGVNNLRFVFATDAQLADSVDISSIWPGKEFVDVLGIDGYNWGDSGRPGGNRWLEFDQVFADMYRVLTGLHNTAPVWICEFGSKEPRKSDGTANSPAPRDRDHDKGRWIDAAFASTSFSRVKALVYYDTYLAGRDNQRDFRFESSPSALQSIKKQLAKHKPTAVWR